MTAVPDGVEEYVAQIRASRAGLGESVAAVRAALADPQGHGSPRRLHVALVELARDLAGHVDLAERGDGLLRAVREAPRLARVLSALEAEHPALQADLEDFITVLERADVAGVPGLRVEVTGLLDRLVAHRRRVGDLLHEAIAVDLGGQG